MDGLQEQLANPNNKSGFFNPDTGEFVFSERHSDHISSNMKDGIEALENDINELLSSREELLKKWDEIEKGAMGEARRPKSTIDPNNPNEVVQKGLSGEEMVEEAHKEVGLELHKIKQQVDYIDDRIKSYKDEIAKLQKQSTLARAKSGEFILMKYKDGWQIFAAIPSKLKTPYSMKFLDDMRTLVGDIKVTSGNRNYELKAASPELVEDFVENIINISKSAFNSLSSFWFKREGFKTVNWYD